MRLSRLLRNNELFRAACIFAALMCLLSLLPLPMLSFQTASRCAVLLAAAWAAAAAGFDINTLARARPVDPERDPDRFSSASVDLGLSFTFGSAFVKRPLRVLVV